MAAFHLNDYHRVVFFTGAGISAESGVPTYRGYGGIWARYRPEEVASEEAFRHDPETVIAFHETRRTHVARCTPNPAHECIAQWQRRHAGITLITQNTDGLHARAGSPAVIELHGSLWRMRCRQHGSFDDISDGPYQHRDCPYCGASLRPDITWFGDPVDRHAFEAAALAVQDADLFVAIGTSGVVWPAAGFIEHAHRGGATMVEINTEATEASTLFDHCLRTPASQALPCHFLPPAGAD